jgi:hypothetical protein
MNHRFRFRQIVVMAGILVLLAGCGDSPRLTPGPTNTPAPNPTDTLTPGPTNTPAPSDIPMPATPSSCTGWQCTLKGVVYADAPSPGNELAGITVALLHTSNCSPTRGQYETITDPDGEFEFGVFLHDTDSFRIEVEQEGYEVFRQLTGGFDCLFCSCPPFEIVLHPLGATTPVP